LPTIYREVSVQDVKDFKEDYFGDIVGVTRLDSEGPIHLVLRFDFNTGDPKQDNAARRDFFYLRTKPFYPYINFPSEKEIEKTGCAEVSMDIIPNKELEGILLRYADTAKILGDEPFRNKMLGRIRNIIEKQEE
jgi:hypothetical protein